MRAPTRGSEVAAVAMLVPAALAVLALAGCGGGTRTVTVDGPPRGASAASVNSGTTAAKPKTATLATRLVYLKSFRSPTGNIGCSLLGAVARCDIEKRGWRPPARPSSCPNVVDFGQGLEVGPSGLARFVCAGDTVRDLASPVLAYGGGSRVGALECVSASSGITCTNRDGHGFFISIQRYRIF